ncbi:polyprenyl synthetase family protein [Lactobacillus sp. LC28-10]|uniref:Polyprenyl synthetase family protein n=1 Tax=Secundilactobacillus angelensis TaxID=2722706 RepID=A0ABX1KYQ3_9LACO|nr:polyprenyl synthetase family protein [Secundilactobacillus angelensis]MCH5462524.1 polyprenyl synthetase family protein [Secundilactobacillus angelensis]NLR18285.1 polyprenyl synthetase family protein [Secundilactobacillus angelensis]
MNLSFWAAVPDVQAELKQLQQYLLKTIDLPNQPIHIKILKLLQSGGKFLRPGTFYLFAQLDPHYDSDLLLAGASAQELLHLAVKFHGQVSDDKLKVAHIDHEKPQRNAIYAGDYLLTQYFEEILKTNPSATEFSDHLNAMQRILSGHLSQVQHHFDFTETVSDYFDEANQRTAEAFRFSAQQGAKAAGADANLINLSAELGAAIGMAYQVKQDVELTFNQPKQLLTSLQNGEYPLPVIMALGDSEVQLLLEKRQQVTVNDVKSLQQQLSRKESDNHFIQLKAHVDGLLTGFPTGHASDQLRQFIDQLL